MWRNQRDVDAQARVYRHFLRWKKKKKHLTGTNICSCGSSFSCMTAGCVPTSHQYRKHVPSPFFLQTKPSFSTNPHCMVLHHSRSINQRPHDSPAHVLPSASSSRYLQQHFPLYESSSLISPCMHVLMHGSGPGSVPFCWARDPAASAPSCWLWH